MFPNFPSFVAAEINSECAKQSFEPENVSASLFLSGANQTTIKKLEQQVRKIEKR